LRGSGAELSERTKALYAATVEHLQSLKAAKMYGVQQRNADAYATLSHEVARVNVNIERQQAATNSLFEIGSVIILALVLYVSIRVLGVSPIAVLLLLAMFARVMPRVMTCHQLYQECLHALPAFENVVALAARCAAAAEPAKCSRADARIWKLAPHGIRLVLLSARERGVAWETAWPIHC
jgi:ATP-binding cassette subfamily C protein